jgi:hypothetical protein
MSAPTPTTPRPSLYVRAKNYLRAHPILCLALLTPGIPEYLSGSSSPTVFAVNPLVGFLFLIANLGIYTAGVLLIWEARVRWKLGWASVLALGVAYGIAEEGLALDTLFNLHASPINPATAGHLAGVNWIWSSQILPFHALFSVALPIFLLETALPGLRGRSLLVGRELTVTFAAYLATISIFGVAFALTTYWMGWPVLLGSLLAITGLVLLARALPRDALTVPVGRPRWTPTRMFLLGLTFFPVTLLVPAIVAATPAPIPLAMIVGPALATLWMYWLLGGLGTVEPTPHLLAFSGGLIAPVIAFGFFFGLRAPLGLPLVAIVDGLAFLFLWKLYHRTLGAPAAPLVALQPAPAP